MIGTRAAYDAVMNCDLLLMVGTDYPYSEFLPDMTAVVQIDERAQALGRRTETALGVVGSAPPTLQLLRDRVQAKSGRPFWDRVAKERRKWDDMLNRQADLACSEDRIHPQAVARMVSDLAAPDAVFALDTGLNHTLVVVDECRTCRISASRWSTLEVVPATPENLAETGRLVEAAGARWREARIDQRSCYPVA